MTLTPDDDLEPLRRAIAARPIFQGPTPEQLYDQLEGESEEIDRALDTACREDPALGIEATSLLRVFWFQRGKLGTGRAWIERLLEATPPGSAAHAAALVSLAALAFRQGDNALAIASSEAAIREARALDRRDIELDALLRRAEEALREDDGLAAVDHATSARRLAIELGDERQELSALHRLAEGTRITGDHEAARPMYLESLERNRVRGDRLLVAVESINLAALEQAAGNSAAAEPLVRQAIGTARDIGSAYLLGAGLVGLAGVLASTGRPADAALVIGRADTLYAEAGLVPDPADKPGFDAAAASARAALGDDEYERLYRQGSTLDVTALV